MNRAAFLNHAGLDVKDLLGTLDIPCRAKEKTRKVRPRLVLVMAASSLASTYNPNRPRACLSYTRDLLLTISGGDRFLKFPHSPGMSSAT